jgi:hypothetical protein
MVRVEPGELFVTHLFLEGKNGTILHTTTVTPEPLHHLKNGPGQCWLT